MSNKVTKSFIPSVCPHCGKDVYVSFQSSSPVLSGVINSEIIDQAKNNLKIELEKIEFTDPSQKRDIMSWIDREDTVFDEDDANIILEQIKSQQVVNK